MSYALGYFPPADSANGWAPASLVRDRLATCSHSTCTEPTAYIWAPGADGTYITACGEHTCDAATVLAGHDTCPKCFVRWCEPA